MVLYDPPSGWRYGFPRAFKPNPNESIEDTLVRDGYPKEEATFGAQHCRFIGPKEELDLIFTNDQSW